LDTRAVGTHCILDLYQCPADRLNDLAFVQQAVADAAEHGVSTLLKLVTNQFDPQGVTVLGLLAESHISAHTWPEHQHLAVDIFACGDQADPRAACHFLVNRFEAGHYELQVIDRGQQVHAATDNPDTVEEQPVCQARN
jgi:S-adenosylmethionine decarboxylase